MAASIVTGPQLHDIQGLVARGYGGLTDARFLVIGFEDRGAARAWIGRIVTAITPADARPDRRAVHVALTASGVESLAGDSSILSGFSNEFADGMTTPHRTRILGDLGPDAPANWRWGGTQNPPVHALLLLYGRDRPEVDKIQQELIGAHPSGLKVISCLDTSDLQGREPFGFRDGISQPLVEGLSKKGPPETTVRFGEFVLGYPNEYGKLTDRPLLDPQSDRHRLLPADGATGRPDLGWNGSYLVFRQLSQDVGGFWRFLDSVTRGPDGGPDPMRRVRLASKMVGRWPGGAPLTLAPDKDDIALSDANGFGYHEHDHRGARCPIGAHIRRANPRDSLDPDPGSARSFAINRRHRILRRGREYGTQLTPQEALAAGTQSEGDERGIHFICLNANIARQFEFVNHTWLNDPKFAGLYDDADPLVGPSEPYGGTFTIQTETLRERVTAVPRFVSVKGGAYFFLPGIAALRWLGQAGD
jgi:Dyp-type peroxidase family